MRQGQYLTELRRSNAAGLHGHKPSRSQLRRFAVQEGLDSYDDMSNTERNQFTKRHEEENMYGDPDVLAEDYVPTGDGPSDAEVWELEAALASGVVDLDELWNDDFDIYDEYPNDVDDE